MFDKHNIVSNNLHRAFYPTDKDIIVERGMFTNERENREYTLFIDSKDRNFRASPNPLKFTVYFSQTFSRSFLENDPSFHHSQNDINIPILVDELNYIYIKTVYFPGRLYGDGFAFPENYIVLRIKELDMRYHFLSSPGLNSQTDILLYQTGTAPNSIVYDSKMMVNLPEGRKQTIKKLTFEFLHSNGTPFTVPIKINVSDDAGLIDYTETDPESITYPGNVVNNVFMEIRLGVNDKQNF